MDVHQLVVPGPKKCDPHEEQSLGMERTPAEEKHDHNGHQHPNQRPLATWEIPGITMLKAITIFKEKKNTYNSDLLPELKVLTRDSEKTIFRNRTVTSVRATKK